MLFKEKLKTLLLQTRALRFRQWMLPRSAVILAYHSVTTDWQKQADYINRGISTDAERFDEQMRMLRQEYNPVTLNDIAGWLRGTQSLPPRSVAVTFDDGFADNYDVAAPIMEKYNIRGTVYLTVNAIQRQELPWFCRTTFLFQQAEIRKIVLTDTETKRTWNLGNPKENREAFVYYCYPCAKLVGEELQNYIEKLETWFGFRLDLNNVCGMMTFDQARKLRQHGHIIGNHTFSHGNLAHIPQEFLYQEIAEADKILEQELGEPVEHFSYPHPCLDPQWNNATLAETKKLNYKTAVLTNFGLVTRSCLPLLLPRIMISNQDNKEFRWKLETALAGIQT
ncbi:MAG: polysaccharide deacetylase family protein [Planctomycetaceae bacterium]|jgi:peptidoglycan/xylan/chitin deacetylase (PgdA/CDA1 family)|nr:polysaccharide deacetylase family protein [Planctomycetaceae bacterium]